MEFFDLANKRQSIRAYQKRAIEEEKLTKILETANQAPSAHNLQSYLIYVVKDQDLKAKIAEAAKGQQFIREADVVLVFVSTPDKEYPRAEFYSLEDATIACYQSWLAAVDLGLSGVWIGAFYEEKLGQVLNLKEGHKPVAILPLGYPAEELEKTPRKKLDSLIVNI